MKKNQSNIWLIILVVIIALIALQIFRAYTGGPSRMVGKPAPELQPGTWITSQPDSLDSLTKNGYVLEFWATWCPPCEQSIPHLKELTRKYPQVPFHGLSTDNSPDPVRQMVREKNINYHVAMHGGMSGKYGVSGIPQAFVINSAGNVAWHGHPLDQDLEKAIEQIAQSPQ